MTVKATREGEIGGQSASTWAIDPFIPFVALPSRTALHRTVKLTNPANGKTCYAIVLDVGPWNTRDPYWLSNARPQAESGKNLNGEVTNGSGIDLGEAVWAALGMLDNGPVEWGFLG
jgi:hypothetical protein